MKQRKEKNTRLVLKRQNIIEMALILLLIVVFNLLSSSIFYRFDLTKEKRFSITEASKKTLSELDETVYIEVFFDGENLPVNFIKAQKVVKEFLDNLSMYSKKIEYVFKNPFNNKDMSKNAQIFQQLSAKGLIPTQIRTLTGASSSSDIIFPGALVKYKEREYPVNFLNNNLSTSNSISSITETELEKEFIHAIWMLSSRQLQKIAFLEGHDELSESQTYDIMMSLSKYYQIDRVRMNKQLNALDEYSAVIVAKPQSIFSEHDKFIIDQYIMNGGSVMWFVEWMNISMDSLTYKPEEMAMINDIKLSDQLFKYGVRINPDLIQDLRCLNIPVSVRNIDGSTGFQPIPWFYFPVIVPDTLQNHQLLKNLEPMRTVFVSSIDTVGEDPDIKKTVLLRTSQYSKSLLHPVKVSLEELLKTEPDIKTFNKPNMTVAVLLEGKFKSNFKNRFSFDNYAGEDFQFLEESAPNTKMIVVSDGDFIRNEVKTLGNKQEYLLLGEDFYYPEQYTPGNTQFIINCINYLCADEDFISIRMREVKMRLLNTTLVDQEQTTWKYLNTIIPILIIVIFGLAVIIFRKIKYKNRLQK